MSVDPRPYEPPASCLGDLLDEVEPQLRSVLRRYAVPAEDAEDLLQEVFLQFLRKERLLVQPAAWLYGALRKECLLYWRRRRRRLYDAIDQELIEIAADPTVDAAERRLFKRELQEAMARLRGRCRVVLSLRYGCELERSAVAQQIGCAAISVDKITRRCLDALGRNLLAPVRRSFRG